MPLSTAILVALLLSCKADTKGPLTDPDGDGDCLTDGRAVAAVLGPDDSLFGQLMPGETAVASAGDLLLANSQAAYVITEPDKGSTYYHYGGIVADAVAMDGCDFDGEDKLDEVGLVLAKVDLGDVASSVVRGFRGEQAEVVADGSDGEAAVVRVRGVDDTYWVVEYTLIEAAMDDGGKELSQPYGVELVVDYVLEPDSPVLRIDLEVTNTGEDSISLVAASLLSFAGSFDLHGYAPYDISAMGLELAYGMPWLVATDGQDALAYAVSEGSLAYLGISGVEVALDITQALTDPIELAPGASGRRTMYLSVGAASGTSATEPLATVNPEPIPDQPYTLDFARGTVIGPDGAGVAGAHIQVQARAPDADWGVLDMALSAADGSFTVPLPIFDTPWEWQLVATADGRHDSEPVEVDAGDDDVLLSISALGQLDFTVLDDAGQPSPARLALDDVDRGDRIDLWLDDGGLAPVPPGTYDFTATRGYEYAPVTGSLTVPEDGSATLDLVMAQVVDTSGYVSVDTHVHSSDSPDSRVAPTDVLLHAAAHGLDIVVHTEHEHIVDRSSLPQDAGLDGWVGSIIGQEVTATIPEHLTMFPAQPDGSPRGGFIEWYGRDIDEIFGLMRERSGGGVNLLNHPSYLDTIGWDRLLAEPTLDDPTLLGLAPDAQLWSWDLDGLEVMNGHRSPFDGGNGRWNNWQSMLNAGHPLIAVGCSDDHDGDEVGFPRTYVPASSDIGSEVDSAEVVDAFQTGRAQASAGAFARVHVVDDSGAEQAGLGELITDTDGELDLSLHIEAIPEIDVGFVSVFVNCDEVLTLAADDPTGVVKLSQVATVAVTEDAHVTVAAFGERYMPAGLPQFDPTAVPRVLTNPIYVDADGDGVWTAPGGRECAVMLTGP